MITRLLLYGATGDLAGRYLFPALAALRAADRLPADFRVFAAARKDIDDAAFQQLARDRLSRHAADVPVTARDALLDSIRYRRMDLDDPSSVASVVREAGAPIAAYLAVPPKVFAPAITALDHAGLPAGSRIAVEKPFGESLEGAVALNALLSRVAGKAREQTFFRVDFVLGLSTIQDLLWLRFANRAWEGMWNSTCIEQVDILWEETLGLEGRAGFFDATGALKDVMQNHMLQVFSFLAMEPPSSLDADEVRDRKVEALRAVRPLTPAAVAAGTRHARYTAGRLLGGYGGTAGEVPDYAAEDGVDPARGTETFAEVMFELDTPRWAGTRFVLRGGKALADRYKGIVIHFRPAERGPFTAAGVPSQLSIGIDGPDDIALHLAGAGGEPPRPAPVVLSGSSPPAGLPAYARVLLDFLNGGSALSVRGDEAEEAWRVVTPVLDGWATGLVPLESYPAGSAGPAGGRERMQE